MSTRNFDPKLVQSMFQNYKSQPTDEAKRVFVKDVSAQFGLIEHEVKKRMELELVWEDFRSNGKDVPYDSNHHVPRSLPTPIAPPSSLNESCTSLLAHASSTSSFDDDQDSRRPEAHTRETFLETYQSPKDVYMCKFCKDMGYGRSYYTSHVYATTDGDIVCPSWNYLQRRNFDLDYYS